MEIKFRMQETILQLYFLELIVVLNGGPWPLVDHPIGYGPYIYTMSQRKYYTTFRMEGPTVLCTSSNVTYSTPAYVNCTYNWTYDTSMFNYVSGQGTNNFQITPKPPLVSGQAWVKLTLTINSPINKTKEIIKNVYVGKVEENKIVSSREGQAVGAWAQYHILCPTGSTIAIAGYDANGDGEPSGNEHFSSQSITSYQWSLPSGWSYSDTYSGLPNQRIQITPNWGTNPQPGQMVQIGIRAQNDCGWTNWVYNNWQVVSCGSYYLQVSPNPSTSESTISLLSENKEAAQLNTDWDLDIYDSFQGLKEKKTRLKTSETKINTSSWKEGVYIIKATIGDKVITEKIIVKH